MAEDALKAAKTDRRTAKSAFTQCEKSLAKLIESKTPEQEVRVREGLNKLQLVFDSLVAKHESYSRLIEDDEEYEHEEIWIESCHEEFMTMELSAKMYMDNFLSKGENPSKVHDISDIQSTSVTELGSEGMSNITAKDSTPETSSNGNDNPVSEISEVPGGGVSGNELAGVNPNKSDDKVISPDAANYPDITCGFKMEKPKMPKFAGDVREYAIFRSDFKHTIESKYSKRDAITFLRSCLQDKPLALIKGIGSDYDSAWEYLDSIYGDPRFVSDTVTQDIVKFRSLQPGEDARFCDLVHLVNRSYNTLKEVGNQNDMNNSHMLSIIEQKMCPDDRKVWSRDLERQGEKATLEKLMKWMTVE